VSTRKQIVVSRTYEPAPEDCSKALVLLLQAPVHNEAARPAPEPDRYDGTKVQGDSANGILPH
jgi:hypothetical protein